MIQRFALIVCMLCFIVQSMAQDSEGDDFVLASVVVAEPGDKLYEALGHACLRLQCPDHRLDYVFSYESEDIEHRILAFFAGRLKMAVRAVPTAEYVEQYRTSGRGVQEYQLNLPLEVKQRLWQQMDRRLTFSPVPYDYMNRGCAVSVLSWIEEAVGRDSLSYATWGDEYRLSRKEIGGRYITDPWHHLSVSTFVAGESHFTSLSPAQKVVVPVLLVNVLQQATAYGQPVLSQRANTLLPGSRVAKCHLVTPTLLGMLLLLIALSNIRLHCAVIRWTTITLGAMLGLFVCFLVFVSSLPCTEWNWLIIPFCPLPLFFWRWRKRWLLPMVAVCTIWAAIVAAWPNQLVDTAHILLALAVAATYVDAYINLHNTSNNEKKSV